MRASLFLLASTLALSTTHAAVLGERAISTAAQLCLTDLQSVGVNMASVADVLHSNANVTASGYTGALKIHSEQQKLEKSVILASTDCCAIPSTVSSEEAEAMLSIVGAFVTRTPSALEEASARKGEFDKILLATPLVKRDISALYNQTEILTTCLLAKTPATPLDYLESAKQYVKTLNNQFAIAKTTYGVKD